VGAAALPLLYEDGAAEAVTRDVLIIAGAGLSVLVLMTYVRAQRVGLSAGAEKAEALARADALTGVGNRRAFDEALTAEVSRTVRAGSPLSVALIDLDDFKAINDRHGHLEGDRYLRQVTAAVTHTIRGGDRCFRWGGDELAVLLPDTPRAEADAVCRRVCAAVTSACSTSDGEPIKLSYGVAELTEGATPIELVRAADEELMHTKERKRAPARFARADATE